LLGETGVGKSFIARDLHSRSSWKDAPFVALNCAVLPENLLESELFGTSPGAFSGAVSRAGALEQVGEGTLFLDEIGELTLAQQAKLLTVVWEGEYRRLGETRVRHFKGRLICATNRSIDDMIRQGTFRHELKERINVNTLHIPPLRDRGPDDLRQLTCHLLHAMRVRRRLCEANAPLPRFEDCFTPEAQRYLLQHPWPGNIRELENLLERELLVSRLQEGRKIDEALLVRAIQGGGLSMPTQPAEDLDLGRIFGEGIAFKELKDRADALMGQYIQRVLDRCGGDKNKAAGLLACSRDTIYKYIRA
jgi:anaerobic nitric oxide reductase transcription regulator